MKSHRAGRHRRLSLEPLEDRRLLSTDLLPLGSETVVFAAFGDYGAGNLAEQFVADMVKGWDPDLIITTGDNNYGSLDVGSPAWTANVGADYGSFILGRNDDRYPEQTSEVQRFFPTVGNHDSYNGVYSGYDGGDVSGYLDYFHHDPPVSIDAGGRLPDGVHTAENSYYSFQWGPIDFFAVDSDHAVVDEFSLAAQKLWLETGLTDSTAPWKFVYFHHAPFTSGPHGSSLEMQWPFQQWGADAVFSGHDHNYERVLVDDVPYFVSGAGGGRLYGFGTPIPGSAVRYDDTFGAMRVTVDGYLATFEFLSIADGNNGVGGGLLVDTFAIDKSVDTAGPRVIDSSVLEGSVLPDGRLVYTARFDEELNATDLDQLDVRLLRSETSPYYPDSFNYDPGTSTLAVEYSGLEPDDYTFSIFSGDGAFEDLSGNDLDGEANPAATVPSGDGSPGGYFVVGFSLRHVAVAGRHVFYNHSAFDGGDVLPEVEDDGAVAEDKKALMPGQTATFANYTSFSQGVNGIMVDIAGLPHGVMPTAADFQFRIGNDAEPEGPGWSDAPDPATVAVRPEPGTDDSDRVTITWDDGVIRNQWLQVTVLADNLGLAQDDVFYFGNAVGDSGDSAADARVNAVDILMARNNPRPVANTAPIDSPYDYDRDQRVNATDMLIARSNQTHLLNALKLITAPPMKAAAAEAKGSDVSPQDLGWLYSLEPTASNGQAAKKETPAEETGSWGQVFNSQ